MNSEHDPMISKYTKFCDCNSPNCRCGEENVHEWTWDKELAAHTVVLSEQDLEVKFHHEYSHGTAAIRGNKLLEKGRLHYWEVKMLAPIYGTDIMVGLGTSKVDLSSSSRTFCSLLGLDQESFGFSYKGYVQHGGEKRSYGSCFGQGCLVGVYLDTWKGTLEFYLNRKPLGIAFTGLQGYMLYPMVSSTAARSRMRLTCSCSVPVSLQIECLSVLNSSQRTYLSTMFPGLRYLTQSIFANILKAPLSNDDDDDDGRDDFIFITEY